MLPWIVYLQLRPLCSIVGAGALHLREMSMSARCLPLRFALAHVVRSSLARVICTSKKSLSAAWASWWSLCLRNRYSAFSLNWLGIGDLGHCVVVNSGGISVCSFLGLLGGSAEKSDSMAYAVLALVWLVDFFNAGKFRINFSTGADYNSLFLTCVLRPTPSG